MARCQRFYMAGDPDIWFRMPLPRLTLFQSEIEPLEAQERIDMLNVFRMSQADTKDGQVKLTIQGWENQAKRIGKVEQPEEVKPSKAEYYARLGRMGLLKA